MPAGAKPRLQLIAGRFLPILAVSITVANHSSIPRTMRSHKARHTTSSLRHQMHRRDKEKASGKPSKQERMIFGAYKLTYAHKKDKVSSVSMNRG